MVFIYPLEEMDQLLYTFITVDILLFNHFQLEIWILFSSITDIYYTY